jgi:hypothetical protein
MIDTDKYEGHTEGPWTWFEYNEDGLDLVVDDDQFKETEVVSRTVMEEVKAPNTKGDALLIADAPLLLEHVKRLTKTLELIGKNMEYDAWMHTVIKEVIGYEKAEVKQLRERVATLDSLMEYIAEDYEKKVIE